MPVFDEAACIEQTLREVREVLERMPGKRVELIAVDDGSGDDTPRLLRAAAAQWPALRVLRQEPNAGQSRAFRSGFDAARGAVIVTLDADGQNDPADIPALLERLATCDCCCGYRHTRRDTWAKRAGSRLANRVRNLVLGEAIIDTGCSLKAFRAELTRELGAWDGMHRFLPALFAMQGARIEQVPVNHRPRAGGRSKYTNLGRLKKTVADLLGVCWLRSRHRPCTVRELSADAVH
jgi:glycosyltransferase involved in cell wall biosynthesis